MPSSTPDLPQPNPASSVAPGRGPDADGLELAVVLGLPDAERLERLLEHLSAQSLAPRCFEVVLVTPSGTDLVFDDAGPRNDLRIELLEHDSVCTAAAWNRALERVRAPLVLFLDGGLLPAPELFARHVAAHAELARHGPGPIAVRGAVDVAPTASPFAHLVGDVDLDRPVAASGDDEAVAWTRFQAGHLSVGVEHVRAVGGFDETSFGDSAVADLELGLRLRRELGLIVVERDDLVALRAAAPEPAAWFDGRRRLGAGFARLHCAHPDARPLGADATESGLEPVLRPIQLAFETLTPKLDAAITLFEKLDRAGAPLDAERTRALVGVVERLAPAAFARGVLEEVDGRDPCLVLERGATPGARTSIVIPSFDALERTRACLAALRRQAQDGFPCELLVVDNGSRDGSREWLAEQRDVTLIANDDNRGAPHARNQALAGATGDWIVFLDNDVVVTPGWLAGLRRHAELDPRAACVGPVTDRAAHGQAVPFNGGDPDAHARRVARDAAGAFRFASLLSSFCLLVRRDVVDTIGGFDERFSPWGFEDDDFTLRCALAGWHNRVAHDVFVQHASYGGAKAERHEALLQENWSRFRAKWGLGPTAARGDYSGLDALLSGPPRGSRHAGQLFVPLSPAPGDLVGGGTPAARSAEGGTPCAM